MSVARSTARRLAALLAACGLGLAAACAPKADGEGSGAGVGLAGGLAAVIPGLGGAQLDPATPPPGFGPQDLAANPDQFHLMWLPSFIAQAGLAKVIQDNGRRVTFESQYGFTAAFDGGFLVGTRGLPEDLMGAYVADVAQALRAGGGSAVRIHDMLGGQDEIVQARYDCIIVAQGSEEVSLGIRSVTGRKFSETCGNERIEFENLYWLDNRGVIIASRQFVTQTVAYLRSNRL